LKPLEYVRGTHFFGGASPLNCWDSLRLSEIDSLLQKIKDDGFNSILLVVPWALFQPETRPIKYDSIFFHRMDKVFSAAEALDLGVILRLGYLWEAGETLDQTHRRYAEYTVREDIRKAWRHFMAHMHLYAKSKPNFQFAFISWEDFYWPMLIWKAAGPVQRRVDDARISGFRDYLPQRISLNGLKTAYGVDIKTWDDLATPTPTEFLYEQYLKFYENEILDALCCAAAENFPGLRMELRVDPEWIKSPEGVKYYHWSMNFPGAATKVVYYHANIARSHTVRHTADEAQMHLRDLLASYCRMAELNEKKPFIDQFNFFDDTYANWSRIDDESVNQFIEKSFDTLHKYSSGYAIWGYFDWCKDVVFNGSFDLGAHGWELTNGAIVLATETAGLPSRTLKLNGGASAKQSKFVLKLDDKSPRVVAVTGRSLGGEAKVRVELSGEANEVCFSEESDETLVSNFPPKDLHDLRLTCTEGSVQIARVQVYDRYYSQGFRTPGGDSRPVVDVFRKLNSRLDELEMTTPSNPTPVNSK